MSRTKNIESAFKIKDEMRYLFLGFIITIAIAIIFIHIILFVTDDDKYIGTTSAVLLGSSTCVALFIIFSNPRVKEVQKFKLVFLGVALWFLGEFCYSYYQIVLNTDAPYPGVGEIFYFAGYVSLILFTYRSFKTINRDGKIKRKVIAFVVILASIVPVISNIQIFSQEVDIQSQWIDILLNNIYTPVDIFLLSLSILILTLLPRNNPYIYHWILFTCFLIFTAITDLIYTYIAIVDEEFLLQTELIWEGMWAFAYLSILASLIWYYKLIHILGEKSEKSVTEDYVSTYGNNISIKDKGELRHEDKSYTENIQDFKLVEDRIDEIIKGAKSELTILFCNINTLKRKEVQSILRFLKNKKGSNILVRILLPFGVDDRIVKSYREVANVRIFERKLENNDIIIVPDYNRLLIVSTTVPIGYDKQTEYAVTYSENEEINYTYITMFEKLWLLQAVTDLEVR